MHAVYQNQHADLPMEHHEEDYRPSICVIGIGGAGCNTVNRLAGSWKEGPDLFAINTDKQALSKCKSATTLQIGKKVTNSQGTGGDPELGKLAAQDDKEKLEAIIRDREFVFLVTGLGGGTGSSVTPILAHMARSEGIMTLTVATAPFAFEGERKVRQAEEALRALKTFSDVVVLIPNDRLLEKKDQKGNLEDTFRKSDEMVGQGIHMLWQLFTTPGLINLDFGDLQSLAKAGGGCCYFGFGEGSGENRAESAVSRIIQQPVMENGALLTRSVAIMVNVIGGGDLTLAEVQQVMSHISSTARPDVHIYMGAGIDRNLKSKIKVSVLVSTDKSGAPVVESEPEADKPEVEEVEVEEELPLPSEPTGVRPIQVPLNLENPDKGRFTNAEPTLYEGEDLDIPTFIRRGVKISVE